MITEPKDFNLSMALLTKYANAALPGIFEPGEAPKPAHTHCGLGRFWQQSLTQKGRQPEGEGSEIIGLAVRSWWLVERQREDCVIQPSTSCTGHKENECIAPGDAIQHKIERNSTNYELRTNNPMLGGLRRKEKQPVGRKAALRLNFVCFS
jgi:hypothetical protein